MSQALTLHSLLSHSTPKIIGAFCFFFTKIQDAFFSYKSLINLHQEPAHFSRICLSILKPALGISYSARFSCSCKSNIKKPPLLFQTPILRFCHSRRKQVLFHTNNKHMIKLKPFGRVHSHKCNFLSLLIILCILIGQQRHLRKKISKKYILIALLLSSRYKLIHRINKLLNILRATQSLRSKVAISLMRNPRFLNHFLCYLICRYGIPLLNKT